MTGSAARAFLVTGVLLATLLGSTSGAEARFCGSVKDGSSRAWSVVRDDRHSRPSCPSAKRMALRMIRSGTGTPGWKCSARTTNGANNGRCVRGRRVKNGLIARERWVFWYLQPDVGSGENG